MSYPMSKEQRAAFPSAAQMLDQRDREERSRRFRIGAARAVRFGVFFVAVFGVSLLMTHIGFSLLGRMWGSF